MADQVRNNAGKLKLSYWLGTEAYFQRDDTCIEFNDDITLAENIEIALAQFLIGEITATELLGFLKIEVGSDAVGEYFTLACMFGEHKYFRGGFMIGAPISHYCDSAARHLKALRNEGPVYIESYTPKSENGEQVATVTCTLNHWEGVCWNIVMIFEVMNAAPQRDDRLFHRGDYSGKDRIQPPVCIGNYSHSLDELAGAATVPDYSVRCEPCDGRYSYENGIGEQGTDVGTW